MIGTLIVVFACVFVALIALLAVMGNLNAKIDKRVTYQYSDFQNERYENHFRKLEDKVGNLTKMMSIPVGNITTGGSPAALNYHVVFPKEGPKVTCASCEKNTDKTKVASVQFELPIGMDNSIPLTAYVCGECVDLGS